MYKNYFPKHFSLFLLCSAKYSNKPTLKSLLILIILLLLFQSYYKDRFSEDERQVNQLFENAEEKGISLEKRWRICFKFCSCCFYEEQYSVIIQEKKQKKKKTILNFLPYDELTGRILVLFLVKSFYYTMI